MDTCPPFRQCGTRAVFAAHAGAKPYAPHSAISMVLQQGAEKEWIDKGGEADAILTLNMQY